MFGMEASAMSETDPRKTSMDDGAPPPSRDQADELAARLQAWPSAFASFQNVPFLALNPGYSNDITPQGIYAFPADWIAMIAAGQKDLGARGRLSWQGCVRRSHVHMFEVEGQMFDLQACRSYVQDATRLREWAAPHYPEVDGVIASWINNGRPTHGTDLDGQRLLMMTEAVVDRILGIDRDQEAPYRTHPDKPARWRELFLAMGYVGLVDRAHLLTGSDFPHQAAVFDEAAIRVLDAFENPCAAAVAHSPSPRRPF